MSRLFDLEEFFAPNDRDEPHVVVAGPGTSLTIPGIIVSEIVNALATFLPVRRIEVDLGTHPTMGLHRAPSLAASHDPPPRVAPLRHRAPRNARDRKRAFRQWIGPNAIFAIAYSWPGIDNEWISDFLQVAKAAGVRTIVLCASLPSSREARAVSLVSTIRGADRVVVGDADESIDLVAAFGPYGPQVQVHRALSLTGRRRRSGPQQLTAFLPSDGIETLTALMGAFDAIPDAQVNNYNLQVITRYEGSTAKNIVANGYHARHVQFFGDDMTKADLRQLCDSSSAISMVDPQLDSRAFSTAVNCGIGTIVLASSKAPVVGRGYVGGLIADGRRPASIHVAMTHAFRLDELRFPNPGDWRELAERVIASPNLERCSQIFRASGLEAIREITYSPELAPLLQPTTETR